MADTLKPEENAELAQEVGTDGVTEARQRFQRLGDEVQNRYKKVSDDVRRGAERAQAEIRRGTETARETYKDVSHKAELGYRRARSEAGNATREVNLFVRDNPGKSVAIAAGIGFLVGLLVRRTRNDD